MTKNLVVAIKLFFLQALLGIHLLALWGLLLVAVFAGVFPVLLCDSGDYWTCFKAGAVFLSIISGTSLASVGLATLALLRPSVLSQVFLIIYSVSLVIFRFFAYQYFSAWHFLLDLIAALGVLALVCVVLFGAGRDSVRRMPPVL